MQEPDLIFQKRILKAEVADWLDRLYGDEEIFDDLKLCSRDKEPSPDGFTLIFFLDNWKLVKAQVLGTMNFF